MAEFVFVERAGDLRRAIDVVPHGIWPSGHDTRTYASIERSNAAVVLEATRDGPTLPT